MRLSQIKNRVYIRAYTVYVVAVVVVVVVVVVVAEV